jgi:hypothetical protein
MSTLSPGVYVPRSHLRRVTKAEVVVCFLAALVMIGASFATWVSGAVGSFSGWDIYHQQGDAGANPFVVLEFFTDSNGAAVPFLTGLTTIISAVWLMVVTAGMIGLSGRWAARASGVGSVTRWSRLRLVLIGFAFFGLVPAGLPLLNAMWYFEGAAPDLALKYGLVVLWVATLVGLIASILAVATPFSAEIRRREGRSTAG